MVRDSGRAERTRESEAKDFFGGVCSFEYGDGWRGAGAGAGIAGEFEPGIAGVDWRRAWD